jgi:hypothetical protein
MFCFLCNPQNPSLPGGLANLKRHFITEHNIFFSRGKSQGFFVCKENDCSHAFTHFSSFSHHVNSQHPEIIQTNSNDSQIIEDVEMSEVSEPPLDPTFEEVPEIAKTMTFETCRGLINATICEIRCKTSIPESTVARIVAAMLKIAVVISMFIQDQFLNFIQTMNIDVDAAPVRMFLNCLDVAKFFKNTESFAKQVRHNLQDLDYYDPEDIFLGQRIDTVLKNNENSTKIIKETFQYFSIIKTLSSLFKFTKIGQIVKTEKKSPFENCASYKDGSEFATHPFLQKFKDAIRINLYYDDIEVANPIGSQSAVYKIAAFYFTVQNVGILNSKLDNIFILAMSYNTDLKKYGFDKVLRPFVEEMKKLESENGVNILLNNEIFTLRATLVAFSGDSLAAHDILGFSSPSSSRFCRQCSISRKEFHKNPLFRAEPRTKNKHTLQLKHLEETNYDSKTIKLYGVKQDSPLNELTNFHATSNCTFDPMHDLLEGVVPMAIKQILIYFILTRKLFSVFDFNDRINRFRYGVTETKNRPSANFTNCILNSKSAKLKQKSSQCWLLLRAFPFLIDQFLEEEDFVYLEVTAKLAKICSIAFATEVSLYTICDLSDTINKFLLQFNALFGDKIEKNVVVKEGKKMINKCHHLIHMPENMLLKGPSSQYNCMRFESKHFPIKQQIAAAHNYVNVPKSIAKRQSLLQAFNIKYNSLRSEVPMLNSFKIVDVSVLSCAELIYLHFGQIEFIKRVSSCTINNTEFHPKFVIRIGQESDSPYPSHAIIKNILEYKSTIYFHCKRMRTLDMDDIYFAFEVEELTEDILIEQKSLVDFCPRNIWQKYADTRKYISIKFSF